MTRVEQLCARARVAASVVHELAGWDEVTELALRLAGVGHVALAPSVLKAHPELAAALDGRLCQLDPAAPFESAADVAVGITEGVLAVAETGSVLLAQGEPGDRAVSLLAHTAVQVVERERIVDSLDDVAGWLAAHAGEHALATIVTGPSRTADIERSLTIGVQGPSALHLVVLG